MASGATTGNTVSRPYGLDYTPSSVKSYNPATDIPSNALDAKNYASIDAWIEACVKAGVPGKIGSGDYVIKGDIQHYAPVGIYGYGATPPHITSQNHDNTWLYLSDHKVTIKGVAFDGFGTVLGGAQVLQPGHPYHADGKTDFTHYLPGGGLMMTMNASSSVVGPAVEITDSQFLNGRNAFTFVSDTTQMGKVDFNNNKIVGTYGIMNVDSLYWTEVNAANNEWSNVVQPHLKNNAYQTGFMIGTDHVETPGHTTKLSIVNNYAHDITSVNRYLDTNAAVFADVRGAVSANHGDNIISFNEIDHVKGVLGQEDSNAIYAKAWGLIIEGNYIRDAGADYVDAKHNGSETAGILVKPGLNGVAKDIEVIGNTLVDMPMPRDNTIDLSAIKLSEAVGDSSVSFNTFINNGNHSTNPGSGIIRIYSLLEHMDVIGNKFVNTDLSPGSAAINFHGTERYGSAAVEVSNNTAELTNGAYNASQKWIAFSNNPGVLTGGLNTLEGGYQMQMSMNASVAAKPQSYTGTQVSSGDVGHSSPTPPSSNPTPPVTTPPVTTPPTTPANPPSTPTSPGSGSSTDTGGFPLSAQWTKVINGTGLDDKLVGTNGHDHIDGLGRNDTMSGGAGDDTYVISGYKDVIIEKAGEGVDTALVNYSRYFLSDNVENAIASGTGPVTLAGNGGNNILQGGKFADILSGRGGNDLHIGGGGADTFVIAGGADVIKDMGTDDNIRLAGSDYATFADLKAGFQQVGADAVLTLQDGSLTLKNVAVSALTPSMFNYDNLVTKAVTGATATHVVGTGTSGSELLVGTDGADLINGKGGADIMQGGAGDDTYTITTSEDRVIELANKGIDQVFVLSANHRMDPYVENATIKSSGGSSVDGNAGANIIKGGVGADHINGGGGNDVLSGGAGKDVFVFHDAGSATADTVTDFTRGQDQLDFHALHAEDPAGTFSMAKVSAGMEVYFDHGGHHDLIVTLNGVSTLSTTDYVI